jgi:hypothetical protein
MASKTVVTLVLRINKSHTADFTVINRQNFALRMTGGIIEVEFYRLSNQTA